MTLYSTHFPPRGEAGDGGDPERPPVLVADGFCWWGLVLGWLVLLRPGSWLVAALAGMATLVVGELARHLPGAWALGPGLNLTVALFANDWRRWELGLAGFVAGPMVAGHDRDGALLRLLDLRPELLAPARTQVGGRA